MLGKENSFEQTLHRRRGSSNNFIESESTYVKVDCSTDSSAPNWDSLNRLHSNSAELGRPDQDPKSQMASAARQKTKVNYNSRLDLKNSPNRLKDCLNTEIRRVYAEILSEPESRDTLYLYLARHSRFYDRDRFLGFLDFLTAEQGPIW